MKTWAESKQMPGQFTGSTGAKVLTPAELSSGYQAWARKVKFIIMHFIPPMKCIPEPTERFSSIPKSCYMMHFQIKHMLYINETKL